MLKELNKLVLKAMYDNIPVAAITSLHEVRNQKQVEELVKNMREHGWHGRQLIVIERESDYLAWTGTHRIAAAIEAGFATVPCYVLPEEELLPHGATALKGHLDDVDRLKILRKVGDDDAIRLMWLENRQ